MVKLQKIVIGTKTHPGSEHALARGMARRGHVKCPRPAPGRPCSRSRSEQRSLAAARQPTGEMNLLSPPYLRRSVRLQDGATSAAYVTMGEPSLLDYNGALQAHSGYQNPTVQANLLAPPHLRRSVRMGDGAASLLPGEADVSTDVAESGRGDALPGTAGIKISAQGPPFLVEGEAILMDEQGALQGQFGYRNPTVQAKDVLVAVNGHDAEELEIAAPGSLHAALKGPRTSLVQLTLVSAATGDKFDVRVRRHAIQQLHQAVTSEQEQATSGGAGYDAGIIIGRPDLQNDEHPVLVVALAPGSNADLCGEVDVGDVSACVLSFIGVGPSLSPFAALNTLPLMEYDRSFLP